MPPPGRGWPDVLASLLAGADLSLPDATWAMGQIMTGEATPVQVAGFLVALRAKGETVSELAGIAETMLAHSRPIEVPGPALDVVGTGGDQAHTVNISTMSAVTAAAAGVTVVKHGNRAASSSAGTADVLEALGVRLDLEPEAVAEVARRCGITFCFAQVFHPSVRHAAVPRRELGIPTVFNVLGPLTNPARPAYSAVGVADPRMAPLVAGVFAERGMDAAVFRGDDGLDEVTVSTTSSVWWVRGGTVARFVVDPAGLGLAYHGLDALRGGQPADNAAVVRQVFAGRPGPVRDAVLLNTGIALAVTAPGDPGDQGQFEVALREGMDRAARALDGGAVTAKLDQWIQVSHELARKLGGQPS
ncbi:MAG TPA: anthranilate phosphoribosyltransferase [Dermatophilaceae bacterium]|nr:anthranilate phosphoribosyltransferase [Dermatophilaceae bacterium]